MKYAHPYCTYAHMTPDGRILYIGKGRISRATIVLKYIKVPRKVCSKRCESRRFRRLKAEAAQSANEP